MRPLVDDLDEGSAANGAYGDGSSGCGAGAASQVVSDCNDCCTIDGIDIHSRAATIASGAALARRGDASI